jgi:hypothetical protein
MQHNYLKDKFVAILLLGISVVLGIMIVVKVRGFFAASARAENAVKSVVAQTKPDANDVEKVLAKSKTIADELKKKNLFVPPAPKKHPVSQVSGILGNEVLIKGKWYKAGDKIGDAKIVAIESTHVKIEWQGKEKVFAPLSAISAAAPTKVVKKAVVKEKVELKKGAAPVEKPAEKKVAAAPAKEDPLAWMGIELSPKARKMLLQQWNKASDEEKQKAKEEWKNVPEEKKQEMLDAIEQMPDSMSIEAM